MVASVTERVRMVARQIEARGVRDARVLAAMREIPREDFVPEGMREFAYEDAPLPIEEGQTISQPYLVALMVEALRLGPEDRVLEVGAGSGYAAAVLGRIAREVFAIERHASLATSAQARVRSLGYENVEVVLGDGTLGLPDQAPFDAIVVAAGGPSVPDALLRQLAIGGRLVIPVGDELRSQELVRVTRTGEHRFERETLGRVRFVPLIGSGGWALDGAPVSAHRAPPPLLVLPPKRRRLGHLVAQHAEPFAEIEEADLGPLLERIGDARVVLLGEATHGTSEFYRMRARVTQALIGERGFSAVCIEGDWPDARAIDCYVREHGGPPLETPAFSRFPTWMWRNRETRGFVDWLAAYNAGSDEPVSVHGLDLYSLYRSIEVVLEYLDQVDPAAADAARVRYGCLSPWEMDPAMYGRAAASRRIAGCEQEVVATLTDLLQRRSAYVARDGESFFDAERNAAVVRGAERYYRIMYHGSRDSWNLRDQHMFETLRAVLEHRGPGAKAVVWAHNSHVGDARATEMAARGELNIGQLARQAFGQDAYLVGFGTDHGTVAAASNWGDPVEIKSVRPAHPDSYERICHESRIPAFLLPLRAPASADMREELGDPRLERAIGVIYRPETELLSHYFQAVLPVQFDEYVWFDSTRAVEPLEAHELADVPETYPFGL